MKKLAVIILVGMLVISSCALTELLNPIVGTWEDTILGTTTRYDFNSDGTALRTVTVFDVLGSTTAGTWTSDSTTLTTTWSGSSDENVDYYSFSEGNSIMTLTPEAGGVVYTFTRQ